MFSILSSLHQHDNSKLIVFKVRNNDNLTFLAPFCLKSIEEFSMLIYNLLKKLLNQNWYKNWSTAWPPVRWDTRKSMIKLFQILLSERIKRETRIPFRVSSMFQTVFYRNYSKSAQTGLSAVQKKSNEKRIHIAFMSNSIKNHGDVVLCRCH